MLLSEPGVGPSCNQLQVLVTGKQTVRVTPLEMKRSAAQPWMAVNHGRAAAALQTALLPPGKDNPAACLAVLMDFYLVWNTEIERLMKTFPRIFRTRGDARGTAKTESLRGSGWKR